MARSRQFVVTLGAPVLLALLLPAMGGCVKQLPMDAIDAAEPLRNMLEREYQLFADSINRWKVLQAERYGRTVEELEDALEESKRALQDKWQRAALRTKLKELEYSLKMQRKRVELLMLQMQAQAA